MKVQYTTDYTDDFGMIYKCGWTAEHADHEAQRRIDEGVCKKAPDDTRARKQTIIINSCITPEQETTQIAQKADTKTKNK